MEAEINGMEQEARTRGAKPKPPPSTYDILKSHPVAGIGLVWRHESDVVHAGSVGRSLQRDGLKVGISAPAWRKGMVLITAYTFVGACAQICVDLAAIDSLELDSFFEAHEAEFRSARNALMRSDS